MFALVLVNFGTKISVKYKLHSMGVTVGFSPVTHDSFMHTAFSPPFPFKQPFHSITVKIKA